jgi:ubiquinone/menaquinone biosynthesis C-methylase UbiE
MLDTGITGPNLGTASYILDPAWHAEFARLSSLTRLYDPTTLRLCQQLGLTTGWRCLDVGAGTGSVARQLAAHVGPTGSVLALDIDTRFLDPLADDTLKVERADVTRDPLPVGEFDLVHARLLLEHLPQRDRVVASLAAALRPGGWLLIEDLDWATANVVDPPSVLHRTITDACITLFARHGYDPYFARTLPRTLSQIGLAEVAAFAESIQVTAHPRHGVPQWELLVEQLTPSLIQQGLVDQADLRAFHALWHDGRTVCFAPLMISAWGRRPAEGPLDDDHRAIGSPR